jgi:hypothetical protein
MKDRYFGLDFLRGLGIFFVVTLHSAFYYFGGLYELDLNNPPPIVTVIGLLLMFAGMFAIISGMVHYIQMFKRDGEVSGGLSSGKVAFQFTVRGAVILLIAYVYFIVTGPGLVDMAAKTMDNSILVELIQSGRFEGVSFERIFYIDSLVMLGSNIILLGLFSALMLKILKTTNNAWFRRAYFIAGTASTALSLLRIPLYSILTDALIEKNYAVYLSLNWLVNKNNPILPYIAFGFFGMWMGSALISLGWKKLRNQVLFTSIILFVAGVTMYIMLPDTMLERSIDMKWYSIMLAQLGLFMLMVLGALKIFDFSKSEVSDKNSGVSSRKSPLRFVTQFITRFGVAGLTVFFLESILSALVFSVLKLISPGFSLNITQALLYGLCLSMTWGIFLIFWEKSNYKFGLEYFYGKIVSLLSDKSSKLDKLQRNKQEINEVGRQGRY